MAFDVGMSDQGEAPEGLAQLFIAADSAIERRRTDNIFKQLDERNLTEEEERIIQQRIELQRRLLHEYEKRELKRKVTELQDLWPELSEAAASRALELCNGKEDEAFLRLTEDAAFKRRVLAETGTYTPVTVWPVKSIGSKSSSNCRRSDRQGSSSSSTRVLRPSEMEGNVFVGRFRSKLGPCQERAVADAAAAAARTVAVTASGPDQSQPKKRGRPKKRRDPDSVTATAAAQPSGHLQSSIISDAGAAATAAVDSVEAAATTVEAACSTDRQRSTSPECEEDVDVLAAVEDDDLGLAAGTAEGDGEAPADAEGAASDATPLAVSAAAGSTPETTDETATNTDLGTDTDGPRLTGKPRQLRSNKGDSRAAERVTSMMVRQIARLEPLLAAGRLLDFEMRRPGSSQAVLGLLSAEYGLQVSEPIATAWEVLLEEQKWKEAEELAAFEASKCRTTSGAAAAAAAQSSLQAPVAVQSAAAHPQPAHLADSSATLQQMLAQRFGAGASAAQVDAVDQQVQQRQQSAAQEHELQQFTEAAAEASDPAGLVAALAAAAALSVAPSPAESLQQPQQTSSAGTNAAAEEQLQSKLVVVGGDVSDASTLTEPTVSPLPPAAASAGEEAVEAAGTSGPAAAATGPGSIVGVSCQPPKRGRGRPPKRQTAAAASAAVAAVAAADVQRSAAAAAPPAAGTLLVDGVSRGGSGGSHASRAISETGHTCRGRVRQKSHKTTELVELGQLVPDPRWYNAGYIFPAGFKSRLLFRSSVDLDALTLHECEIVGEGGKYWPAPTFVVTARDREEEPMVAKSCTGCWSGILKRINSEILRRIEQGEALPPPPRTAIAGPEYFGLNDTTTIAAIETLDPDHLCTTYWAGKEQREAAAAGMPIAVQPKPGKGIKSGGSGSAGGRKRGRRGEAGDADDEGEESGYRGAHWSSISRRERYIKRCTDAGDEAHVMQEQQLLPGVLDPITLEPIVNPAISPAGHVMGLATWKAVLTEQQRCPFTKVALRPDQLIVLSVNNIEKYRERIIAMR